MCKKYINYLLYLYYNRKKYYKMISLKNLKFVENGIKVFQKYTVYETSMNTTRTFLILGTRVLNYILKSIL